MKDDTWRGSPLFSLWKHFKDKRATAIAASIYSVLNKVFDIAPPLLIGLAVDTVVKGKESFVASLGIPDKRTQIYVLGALTFMIWAFESLFEFLLKIKWRGLAQEVQHSLRREAYDHLQSLNLSFFEDQSAGNLTTALNDDINQLERFLDIGANDILQLLTTVVSIGAVFFAISPQIALLSFLPTPLILLGSFAFQKRVAPRYAEVRGQAGLLASCINNNIAGIATIKSYVAQKFESERIAKQSQSYSNANKRAILLASSFSPLIRMIVLCGFLFALILGGIKVLDGNLEVGAYTILIFLVQRLLWPLTRLGETFDLYQRSMASAKRVLSLLSEPVQINDGEKEADPSGTRGEISFMDVSFSYQSSGQVLKNANLEAKAGETIALVGPTGSGKSTVLKLLLRFYDPVQGEILLDGENIKNFKQDSLRSLMGFVAQDAYLFHGTVRENILYGSFEKSQKELEQAAKVAEAHEFIQRLPQGYDTVVGERGQKLSGGQRQRIGIARALIKDPKIFIFDEATSAVDNETEAAIQRSLQKITKGRTTIMVAHRLSTIKNADKIYVLDDGKIVEQGSHEELLQHNGLYKALWNVQTGL